MVNVTVNQHEIESVFLDEVRKRLDELEQRVTFWDMKELVRQTNMSEPFIKEKFFYDEDFPKYKVGSKWVFPAKETESFLLKWIKKQNRV